MFLEHLVTTRWDKISIYTVRVMDDEWCMVDARWQAKMLLIGDRALTPHD